MTDYERHADLLAGPRADMYEVASVLGSHGFRVCPLLVGRARGVAVLIDAVTHEPIANVTGAEARELAAWLERERPLPARTVAPYTLTHWRDGRVVASNEDVAIRIDDDADTYPLRCAIEYDYGYTPEERGT